MESGDIEFLKQLISSLEEGLIKLEEAKKNKNYELFSKIKREIINIHQQIQRSLK